MKIEASEELVAMVEKSAREWRKLKPQLDEKYHHYDVYCEEEFGMKVDFSAFENAVIIHGATVIDDDKYINFLLRFGNMHDE